jgi:hypothetical protein
VPRRKPQEQARKSYTARALNRAKRNANTNVALEAKALAGGGVEVPAAILAVTETLRKIETLSEGFITAIGHELRQLLGHIKACHGPTPGESVVAASGLAKLSARLEKESWSESPPLASGPID